MPQQQLPPIELSDLKGLSLKLDNDYRDPSSCVQLDNFDCFVPGSWRKMVPPVQYGVETPSIIANFIDYRANDSAPRQIVGVGIDGKIYDLLTGLQIGDCTPFVTSLPLVKPPFLGMMPGTYIPYNFRNWIKNTAYALNDALIKYSYQDGNLYIYVVTVAGNSGATESAYPNSGSFADGGVTWTNIGLQADFLFARNYLVIQIPGQRPLKWDGTNVTQIGVSAPGTPVTANPAVTTPNLNGYSVLSGAFYCFTFFNPQTLHESSPSPLFAVTTFFAVDLGANKTINGCMLPPLPLGLASGKPASSYQEVRVCMRKSDLQNIAIGQGFTHVRCYRTKDGGSVPLLLTTLYDINGNIITNSDGSIPIASLSMDGQDYEALPTPQSAEDMLCAYDGYGLPNLVPGALTLSPDSWVDFSTGLIVVLPNASPDGNNAFSYTGTGAPSGVLYKISAAINITVAGNYTLQGYIDASQAVAGAGVAWVLVDIANPAVAVLSAGQLPGAKGVVSATGLLAPGVYALEFIVDCTVPLGASVLGGDPILQFGNAITTIGYPVPDSALVVPAPGIGANNPPPVSEWAATYGNSLFVLDEADKVRLRYSSSDDFESFSLSSIIRFPGETDDEITSLLGVYNALVIGKKRSTQLIEGNVVQGFSPSPVDPQHGILGKRSMIALGSALIGLLNTGLSIMGLGLAISSPNQVVTGFRPESLVGDDVQPFTDAITPASLDWVSFAYDTKRELLLFALGSGAAPFYSDTLLVLANNKGPRFSTYSALTGNRSIATVRECELPDGSIAVLATCTDRTTQRLFAGAQDGSVTATVETQILPKPSQVPKELWGQAKVFRTSFIDGVDLANFRVSYSVDGGPWSAPMPLLTPGLQLGPGLEGSLLKLKFTHAAATLLEPKLSYISIDWDIIGMAR